MTEQELLQTLNNAPASVRFADAIAAIDGRYHFTPTRFSNGALVNEAGQNNGSCKIFAFAKLHALDPQQTLNLFGDYYRKDVLENSTGDDHQNIRNFIQNGWLGIKFDQPALQTIARNDETPNE